jgi:LuxR family maltose regulon positive regulatory protein
VRLALAQQAADAGATASAAADVAQRMAALPDGALRLAELPAGFGGSRRGGDGSGEEAGVPVLIERLSRREHEVLELMSGMLTTAEIAGELYLSPNTVKSHVRSILRKLGASRRGEAVRRARELRLLRS